MKEQLQKQGIEALYKYKSGNQELQGISFKIGEYKGSAIDRQFSLKNLERSIGQNNKLQLKPFKTSSKIDNKVDNYQNKSITKANSEKYPVIEELMKPEKNQGYVPYELKKKKKKQQLRLH